MSCCNLKARKRRVFLSVFETNDKIPPKDNGKYYTYIVKSDGQELDQNHHQNQWNASWNLVTQILSLPKDFDCKKLPHPREYQLDKRFSSALQTLLYPPEIISSIGIREDIISWLSSDVRKHYLNQVFPSILQLKHNKDPEILLIQIFEILKSAYRQYEYGLSIVKEQIDIVKPGTSLSIVSKFYRDLNAIISNTIMSAISIPLKAVLKSHVASILKISSQTETQDPVTHKRLLGTDEAEGALLELVDTLKKLNLTGEYFQVILAEIMIQIMSDFINRGFQGSSSNFSTTVLNSYKNENCSVNRKLKYQKTALNPSQSIKHICGWIENEFAKVVFQVLSLTDGRINVSWAEKLKFKEIGIRLLAELRTKQLFDIVQNWPQSGDALDDLRAAITTPERRLHLTEVFAHTLARKILHPAASTTLILQTYVSMIWSFHSIDHSKVLLDKVAYPLQLYLCSREDTVKIIIISLLSDPDEVTNTSNTGEKLIELSWLLNNESEHVNQRACDEDLDWHDLDWVPDPVDAGPGYKRSKNADVIGTLIRALGSKEVFIKEFQIIIGENLLKNIEEFHNEIKVLELLKIQYGEAPLQACEVMLKDIQDSKIVDGAIQKFLGSYSSEQSTRNTVKTAQQLHRCRSKGLAEPSLHSKILSRLYWPQLHLETYCVPSEVSELQKVYEEGFESIKSSRKLTWLDKLGQATVKLEFEDRTLIEEVHTWQATVIWAFQNDKVDEESPNWTVQQLLENLEMEEGLVRNALRFWVKKFVLYELVDDTYAVRETLSSEDQDCLDNQTNVTRIGNESDQNGDGHQGNFFNGYGNEKMETYWQFILGMLTNSSSQMPLQQIATMLKMLLIDGFPHSNDDLKVFLEQKIADGVLEMVGDKYRLKK